MASNSAESLTLPTTLDTTLDREQLLEEDEMPAENQLVYATLRTPDAASAANNDDGDELRHFIGQEEFEEGVQRWKEVRYYHYYYFYPHLSKKKRIKEREREREKIQNIIIFNFF